MRVATLAAFALLLHGCLTQNPAPVSLKGEEFYGNRELDESSEYRLIRDSNNGAQTLPGTQQHKMLVRDISPTETGYKSAKHDECKFSMPMDGRLVSKFDKSELNGVYCDNGVAIVADGVSQVRAAADGKVLYIGRGLKWHGNLVILEHDKYTITLYSHLHSVHTKIGNEVKRGEVIASVSRVGSRTDSEYFFCFSMRHNGKPVNPVQYMKECKRK